MTLFGIPPTSQGSGTPIQACCYLLQAHVDPPGHEERWKNRNAPERKSEVCVVDGREHGNGAKPVAPRLPSRLGAPRKRREPDRLLLIDKTLVVVLSALIHRIHTTFIHTLVYILI